MWVPLTSFVFEKEVPVTLWLCGRHINVVLCNHVMTRTTRVTTYMIHTNVACFGEDPLWNLSTSFVLFSLSSASPQYLLVKRKSSALDNF